jgi:hypothetical protein
MLWFLSGVKQTVQVIFKYFFVFFLKTYLKTTKAQITSSRGVCVFFFLFLKLSNNLNKVKKLVERDPAATYSLPVAGCSTYIPGKIHGVWQGGGPESFRVNYFILFFVLCFFFFLCVGRQTL